MSVSRCINQLFTGSFIIVSHIKYSLLARVEPTSSCWRPGCKESRPVLSLALTVIKLKHSGQKCHTDGFWSTRVTEEGPGMSGLVPLLRNKQYRQQLCPGSAALKTLMALQSNKERPYMWKTAKVAVMVLSTLCLSTPLSTSFSHITL
jgi:hypothetical protein